MKLHITFSDPFDKIADGETTFEAYSEQCLEMLNSSKTELRMNKDATLISIKTEWGKEAYYEIDTDANDLYELDADFTMLSDGLEDKYNLLGDRITVFDFENNLTQAYSEGEYDTGSISHPENEYEEYVAGKKTEIGV